MSYPQYPQAIVHTLRAMPIYLVTPLGHNTDQVGEAVRKHFEPEDLYELQSRSGWFVNYRGTTLELSNLLGITSVNPDEKPTLGSAMVTSVGSYYGRGATTMWEWLKTRFESR